jgi:hypothetical protein
MDADAEPHLFFRSAVGIFLGDRLLHRDRAFNGIDGAGEIRDYAVAGGIENTTVMNLNKMVENCPIGLKLAQGANLVDAHQAAVLGDVGGKDGRELPLDPLAFYHLALLKGAPPRNDQFSAGNIAFLLAIGLLDSAPPGSPIPGDRR